MFTATTIPLIVLSALLWRWTKGELLSMVLFLSIFEAASGLNIGAMGVAPWLLVLVGGLIVKTLQSKSAPRFIPGINTTAVRILLVFVFYAVISGMIYPFLFAGTPVIGSHSDLQGMEPLAWGMANVAQICYLLAAVSVFLFATFSSRQTLNSALDWYIRGCVTASAFAMYQLANALIKIPYPSVVLYSNPRYIIYPAYTINGMWRLNSTFTEASAMAGHLSIGIALCSWKLVTRPFRWSTCLAFLAMTVAMLFSISTTGYFALLLILAVVGGVFVSGLLRKHAISHGKAILLLLLLSGVTVVSVVTSLPSTVERVLLSVFVEKQNSNSYRERTESNEGALQTARETYYLGAGWGSVRCSSLVVGLLGEVGIPGIALFTAFLLSLLAPLMKRRHSFADDGLFSQSLFAVFILIAEFVISSNEPVQPILWALFAACAAGPSLAGTWTNTSVMSRYLGPRATLPLAGYSLKVHSQEGQLESQ